MDEEKRELVQQFAAVSGVDLERAKFYLESSAWSIETALSSFFENQDDDNEPPTEQVTSKDPPTPKDSSMPVIPGMDDSGNSSSDEEGQAFYAGGSAHSGQQVLGPSKKKDVVSKLFKSARDHGAEMVDPREKSKTKKTNFSGSGYRLGENEDDHEVIPGAHPEQKKSQEVTLKMWKEGFSLDDGPMRGYEDSDNRDFLKSVMRGEIPMELVRKAKGGEVFINMEDHRHEEFVQPKVNVSAFSGEGHSLGSPAPTVIGQVTNLRSDGASGPACSTSNQANEDDAKSQLNLQSDQPTTNIQLRLPNGSRIVAKMNHSHTVGDIRSFVITARPELAATTFAVMTTFPHAELEDDSLTLAEGKLLNSSLVIKPK